MNKFLTALPLALVPLAAFAQTQKKPNILWIVTDDHRADALECWNREQTGSSESALGYVMSPNLDKLAQEGVLFTNSYCNSPLSGPSRASLQTGKYPHHNGAFNFQLKHNEYDCADPMVPELMREAGYSTAAFGKLGYYIYKYQEPMTFTYPDSHYEQMITERMIERTEVADFSNPNYNDLDAKYARVEKWHYPDGSAVEYELYPREGMESEENRAIREKFQREQEFVISHRQPSELALAGQSTMPTDRTEDGLICQVFDEYVQNSNQNYISVTGTKMVGADTQKPQFVYVGYHFPHTPVLPSKEYRDIFKQHSYKLPKFEQWEVDKMPRQMKMWQKNYSFYDFTPQEQQQQIQDYYAFCAMGDELIGRTVESFKAYCKENDQPYLIVFACGDHGWHLGEQGAYFKWTGFLKSNETAIIVVSSDKDKFPAGKVVRDYAEYVDFAPTFYAAAGYDLSQDRFEFLDGRDLYLTANEKVEPREYVLGEVSVYGNRAFIRGREFSFSMRSRKNPGNPSMKDLPNANVKWPLECTAEEAEMGLYDLRVDPNERNNVAYDPQYVALAAWFREKLGNIVLGDGRFEAVWDQKNVYNISNFAEGSDDKRLDIPSEIIPEV